jgi:hypothetical protein
MKKLDLAELIKELNFPEKICCAARTRKGTECQRKPLINGRCPNHGGLSTGPKSDAGRVRIARAQKKRWARWRKANAKN